MAEDIVGKSAENTAPEENTFNPITTQDEFDSRIKERLARQSEKHVAEINELNSKYSETETKFNEQLKELELFKSEFEQIKSENSQLIQKQLRQEVALENGLPMSLADRLQGNTKEQLIDDARKLSEFVSKPVQTPPTKSYERPVGDEIENAFRSMTGNLFKAQGE